MNIFEYLGLPADHRKLTNKVTQLVKHWDEVPESRKEGKKFAVQTKKDGVCTLTIIKGSSVSIWSRTGKRFTNTGAIVKHIKELKLPEGVYLGELWLPKDVASLEELSGLVNPNRVNPISKVDSAKLERLTMSWFDLVNINHFVLGTSNWSYSVRYSDLNRAISTRFNWSDHVEVLSCIPECNAKDIDGLLHVEIALGEEGIIIRDPDADWEAGHKGWRVMKKVRGVDYDLQCIGWEEGTGKYKGKVANLIFEWKGGKTIKCMLGKGWTHDMAREMYVETCKMGFSKGSPLGKIFQVYALEESSKGKLRLPKVGEQRFDKEVSDVN